RWRRALRRSAARAAGREPAAARACGTSGRRRLRDRIAVRRECRAGGRRADARPHRPLRRRGFAARGVGSRVRPLLRGPSGGRDPIRDGDVTVWSFAAYLLLPYALWNLLWRGFRYRPYWNRWPERFGFVPRAGGQRIIWVHAVSVGEVRSAAPLIVELDARYPEHRIHVTTMTPTGSEQVRELFGERVGHSYVPYDLPDAVGRFLDRIRPDLAVIAETEFWPNIFAACRRRGIPLFLVNVRVSQASLRGYLRAPRIIRDMLHNADLICPQTEVDAERLRRLGAPPERIVVTGNLKFDVPLPESLMQEAAAVRQLWGRHRPIWIAASTHAGEETQVLDA